MHVALPLAGTEQVVPHAPQFCGSPCVSVQPLPHVARSALQLKPQTPPVQVGEPPEGDGHALPQAPQFVGESASLTHEPPQLVNPSGQEAVQPFALQT